jgi:nucleoside 2-deoxyribosyltransferase
MAFFRPDTEDMFEKSIRRALEEEGVQAIRVDKVEHNDNIDDRIFSEIESSDFAIADLTYARPSVYYEAGFAERAIPVIYTIRRDHLKPRADDEFGVLQLHFDLAMRNVIDWATPDDEIFLERLRSRIKLIAGPIAAARESDRGEVEAARRFGRLSISERGELLEQAASDLLVQHGFQHPDLKKKEVVMGEWHSNKAYFRGSDDSLCLVDIIFKGGDDKSWLFEYNPSYNLNITKNIGTLNELQEYLIIISFNAESINELAIKYSDFEVDQEDCSLKRVDSTRIPKLPKKFRGSVVLASKYMSFGVGESVKRWFQSKPPERKSGFNTDRPQPSLIHEPKDYDGYFVHGGFKYREVDRLQKICLLDEVKSKEDFTSRLESLLEIDIDLGI